MSTICSVTTRYNADAVDVRPRAYDGRFVLAVGTYQLDNDGRKGGIHFYSAASSALFEDNVDHSALESIAWMPSNAVFDLEWCSSNLLGHAAADGRCTLFKVGSQGDGNCLPVQDVSCVQVSDKMCLSLSFSSEESGSVACSSSDGQLVVFDVSALLGSSENAETNRWKAHDFETWVCSFDKENPSQIYSGADDCLFKGWDTRQVHHTFVNKSHEMGVCCIQSHPFNPQLVCTGSYDEKVRIFDRRSLRIPLLEHEMGGGVWKLKWHPLASHQNLLLCAVMHNGFSVLDVKTKITEPSEAISNFDCDSSMWCRYTSHESLAYGCDWSARSIQDDSSTELGVIASCSFYDSRCDLWQPNLSNTQ